MFKKRLFYILFLLTSASIVTFGQKISGLDFAKKIADATPSSLPQQPIPARPSTDARDQNLKGKVKILIESSLEPKAIQYTESEKIFSMDGNYLQTVSYDNNYPISVTVWGYIDSKRVGKTGNIIYEPSEKPKSAGTEIVQALGNPDAPGDGRFDNRKEYKYDSAGRLISEATYGHADDLFNRITYSYKGNERDKRDHDSDGNEISRTVEILDKDGNVIEEHGYGRKLISTIRFMTYEFDSQGNWIVQKTYDAKGKTGRRLIWSTFRTITYYP